jgi:hypothetical protein
MLGSIEGFLLLVFFVFEFIRKPRIKPKRKKTTINATKRAIKLEAVIISVRSIKDSRKAVFLMICHLLTNKSIFIYAKKQQFVTKLDYNFDV